MLYSSASCYPNENAERQQPQDRRQDRPQEDVTTSPLLLVAAAGRLSWRRSSPHPALVSARLPAATFDLEDDDLTMSNTSSISSRRENEKPSTATTSADRHSADMSRIAKILDQALEILKSGDDDYSLDDDRLDRYTTISCDPSSFFY